MNQRLILSKILARILSNISQRNFSEGSPMNSSKNSFKSFSNFKVLRLSFFNSCRFLLPVFRLINLLGISSGVSPRTLSKIALKIVSKILSGILLEICRPILHQVYLQNMVYYFVQGFFQKVLRRFPYSFLRNLLQRIFFWIFLRDAPEISSKFFRTVLHGFFFFENFSRDSCSNSFKNSFCNSSKHTL